MNRRTPAGDTGATAGPSDGGSGAGAGPATDGGNPASSERDGLTIIAHRGYAGQFPENTVGAVSHAAETADAIEIDAVPTADGTVVAFHDDDLGGRDDGRPGLTDLDGCIWERPWAEVRKAEVLDSGETVPSLERILEAIPADVGVNVELKNPGSTDVRFARTLPGDELAAQTALWRPMVEETLRVVARADNDVLVSSFYEAALAAVRELAPRVPIAFLFRDSIATGLRITRTYDCEALHPPLNLLAGTPFFRDGAGGDADGPDGAVDLVAWAHERGKAVNAWTIRTWYQAERVAEAGVDGLIADYPNLRWTRRG